MRVQHKNSLEIIELDMPTYHKLYNYGYLVGMNTKVFFIYCESDLLDCYEVTDDFIIL